MGTLSVPYAPRLLTDAATANHLAVHTLLATVRRIRWASGERTYGCHQKNGCNNFFHVLFSFRVVYKKFGSYHRNNKCCSKWLCHCLCTEMNGNRWHTPRPRSSIQVLTQSIFSSYRFLYCQIKQPQYEIVNRIIPRISGFLQIVNVNRESSTFKACATPSNPALMDAKRLSKSYFRLVGG
jgi:hypothetical protein